MGKGSRENKQAKRRGRVKTGRKEKKGKGKMKREDREVRERQ
jgi:hypothetical protein